MLGVFIGIIIGIGVSALFLAAKKGAEETRKEELEEEKKKIQFTRLFGGPPCFTSQIMVDKKLEEFSFQETKKFEEARSLAEFFRFEMRVFS